MGIYEGKVNLLKEGLVEMITAAEYTSSYWKTDKRLWGHSQGGILGYPTAVLLFATIDCLGSVYCGNENFKIKVGTKKRHIASTSEHIFILNSDYFGMDYSHQDLINIHNNFRSALTHNLIMPQGYTLDTGDESQSIIQIIENEFGNTIYRANLIPMLSATRNAVIKFLERLEKNEIEFEKSRIHENTVKKDVKSVVYQFENDPSKFYFKAKKWIVK